MNERVLWGRCGEAPPIKLMSGTERQCRAEQRLRQVDGWFTVVCDPGEHPGPMPEAVHVQHVVG